MLDRIAKDGHLPAVVTVGSFVTATGEIVGVHLADHGYRLDWRPAGAWADGFTGARVVTGPGRPWVVLHQHPSGTAVA